MKFIKLKQREKLYGFIGYLGNRLELLLKLFFMYFSHSTVVHEMNLY